MPSSDIQIVQPTKGEVTLALDWDTAEVLTRCLAFVNSGSLHNASPALYDICEKLNRIFGRNIPAEANKYMAVLVEKQVYIDKV